MIWSPLDSGAKTPLLAITRVVAVSTIMGGLVFQGAVIAMPKLFEEGLGSLADSILGVGLLVSLVIGISAFGKIIVGHLIDRMRIKYVWIGMLFVQVPLLQIAADPGKVLAEEIDSITDPGLDRRAAFQCTDRRLQQGLRRDRWTCVGVSRFL